MSEAVLDEPRHKTTEATAEESMNVRLSRLDNMLELAGEVIIVSSNLSAISRQIREGQPVSRAMSEDIRDLAVTSMRISSDLHNLVSDVRTVDMTDLFARFQRLARDTSRRVGKAIRFEVEGQNVSIDKKISEKIYDPIAHQIRNAIAHGIEDEQTRRQLGKDPVGTVAVRVTNLENSTVISITDDGRGIDHEMIRRRITDMHLVDREIAEHMSRDELFEYLFLPGFSTVEKASQTAGRGVGLDVVRDVISEINGEVRLETRVGEGTKFSLALPMVRAVNISDALLVRANKTHFAFPILSVVATISLARDKVTTTTGKGLQILYLGQILPLFDLLNVFGEHAVEDESDELRILIIEHRNRKVAYVVSDFLNPQKIVITEFHGGIEVPGLLGTAVLSGRQLAMVVDPQELLNHTLGLDRQTHRREAALNQISAVADGCLAEEKNRDGLSNPSPTSVDKEEQAEGTALNNVTNSLTNVENEYDSAFLQEVESMLSRLNRELLALDESRDTKATDSIFRLMHSIKGNLTMCGAEEPASIAHKTEAILARIRDHSLEFQDEVFDVLFDCSEYLEKVVRCLQSRSEPPHCEESLITNLDQFHSPKRDVKSQSDQWLENEDEIPLDATGEFYLSSRRRQGARLFQISIDFESGDQPDFLVAYLILRKIQNRFDVIGTLPTMRDIEGGLCGDTIRVLVSLLNDKDDVVAKTGENLKRYYGVTRYEASAYA